MPLSAEQLAQFNLPTVTMHSRQSADPIYSFAVPGRDAVSMWSDLRKRATQFSYWPVIFGEPKHLERLLALLLSKHAADPADTLEAAESVDVSAFFDNRAQEFSDEHVRGDWPRTIQAMEDFTLPRNILKHGEFLPLVNMGLVPANAGFEVPAQLSFGGWNDCPSPAEQVAVLRYWDEKYGAELVGLSDDVLELRISRRPNSKEDALQVAREQFWFCYDIVEQGVGTIENLAATLLASDIWYFWWD